MKKCTLTFVVAFALLVAGACLLFPKLNASSRSQSSRSTPAVKAVSREPQPQKPITVQFGLTASFEPEPGANPQN